MKFTNLDNEYNSINVLDKPLDFVNVESEENDFLLLNPVVIEVPNVKESLEEEPSIVIKTPNVYKCLPEYLEVENALSEFNTEELKQRARENLNIKSLDESKFYTKEEIDNKGFITDISNKQDVISDLDNIRSGASKGATAVLPETLANVATSGSYEDLTGKPTIPTKTSELENDSGFLAKDFAGYGVDSLTILNYLRNNAGEVLAWSWKNKYIRVYDASKDDEVLNIHANGDGTKFLSDNGAYKTIDLAGYAKTTDLNNKLDIIEDLNTIRSNAATALQSIPDEYVTETELNDKGYLTEHLDISGKQDKLISGTTIKTIDGKSVLGSGNISLPELNAQYDETKQRLILLGVRDNTSLIEDSKKAALKELLIGDTIYEVNPLEQLSVDLNSDEIIINGDNNSGDSIMSVTIPQATALKAGVVGTDLFNLIHKNANLIENISDLIQDVVAITNTETETCNFLKRDVVINSYGKNILQIGGNIVKNLVDGVLLSGLSATGGSVTVENGIVVFSSSSTEGKGSLRNYKTPTQTEVVGHKYYQACLLKCSENPNEKVFVGWGAIANTFPAGYAAIAQSHTDWQWISVLYSSFGTGNYHSVVIGDKRTSDWGKIYVKNYLHIDLTEMFGAGNEPTKEECDALFSTIGALPKGLSVAQPTGLKSTGYNQFNPKNVLINKSITDNAIVDGDKNIAVVECLPCKVGAGENNGYVIGYGEGDNWSDEGVEVCLSPLNPMEIEGELYMSKLEKDATYGTYVPKIKGYLLVVTPTTDKLCAHLHWSGDRAKTDYEEYAESNVALPVIPEMSEWGLAGISASGTLAADTIDLERMVYTKRIGCIDLGSMTWTLSDNIFLSVDSLSQIKGVTQNFYTANIFTARYTTIYFYNSGAGVGTNNRVITLTKNKNLIINDSSYTDAASLKASLQGVLLYYELAEPEEYPIVIQSSITYISGNSEEIIGSKIPVNVILNLGDKRSLVTETTKFLDLLYENTNTNNAKETADVITNALLLAILTLEISPNEDDVELDLINTLGTYNHVVLPAATTESAGVMSAEDKKEIAENKTAIKEEIERAIAAETDSIEQGRRAALIDMYRLIGASYNKSTDTFTLNTVAGLSWTDMGTTFAYRDLIYRLNLPRAGQQISNLRVLAPLVNILTSPSINIQGLNTFYGTSIELFALCKLSSTGYDAYLNSVRTDTAPVCTYMYDTFRLCSKLKTVFPINLKGCKTLKKESFGGCVALEELRLLNLPLSLNLDSSPLISKTSILYIITNAAPESAITITLHPDAYARLASDADIVAALEAQPLVTLVSA